MARLGEEAQEVELELERWWSGVVWRACSAPGQVPLWGSSTMKVRLLHGGRGPDSSYLPSA